MSVASRYGGRGLSGRPRGRVLGGIGWRVVQRPKEALVTEGSMPPAEKPTRSRAGEQEHLREDAGQPGEVEREGEAKGPIDKAKDKLKGR